MKVAVIGGGSTYTPELVSGLSRERERVPVAELVLHDIDPMRRQVVGEMAARMLERQGFAGSLEVTDDLDARGDRGRASCSSSSGSAASRRGSPTRRSR